jgi:tetratricopeptide (TPR) repeat protein
LLIRIGAYEHAASALESALGARGFDPRSFRQLFDLYWKLADWDRAIAAADKAIAYWAGLRSDQPQSGNVRNELVEEYGIKANALDQKQDWVRAVSTAEQGFLVDPSTNNRQLVHAEGAALRGRFNLKWKDRDWDAAIDAADALISYWTLRARNDPQNGDTTNELIEGYGIKSNTYDQMGNWQQALRVANEGFAVDPDAGNPQIIYAKGEALHVSAGLAVTERNYPLAEELIDEAIATYERGKQADPASGRYADLLSAKRLLAQKKAIMKVVPASVQRVLAMIVTGIDIDQTVNGKQVRVKDGFPDAVKQRLRAGQAWYRLYVECATAGRLSILFKDVDVGTATRVNAEGLTQIEPDSIQPSVAPLVFQYKDYDAYAFYWNGATNGLNGGTGVGGGWWPMTLVGVEIGQPRGFTTMATNPEMYGVFDGLLQHEYGHVLEVIAGVGFVHCKDMSPEDRNKLTGLGWDGDCADVYQWVLGSFMKGKYADMNWATRYPSKITARDFDAMMKAYATKGPGTTAAGTRD